MATVLEMAAEIVAAHASTTNMSKEELVAELNDVYNALNGLEKGEAASEEGEQQKVPRSPVRKLLEKTRSTA